MTARGRNNSRLDRTLASVSAILMRSLRPCVSRYGVAVRKKPTARASDGDQVIPGLSNRRRGPGVTSSPPAPRPTLPSLCLSITPPCFLTITHSPLLRCAL